MKKKEEVAIITGVNRPQQVLPFTSEVMIGIQPSSGGSKENTRDTSHGV